MILKKITLFLIILATVNFKNDIKALSNNSYAECYKGKDGECRYLEFYFIEQVKNQLNEHVKKARATLLTTIASIILCNEYFKKDINKIINYPLLNPQMDLAPIASASLLAFIGFDMYTSFKEAEIKHDILIEFLTNWEFHKQYIPISLIPAFEELVTAFNAAQNKRFSPKEVFAIFEVIQHILEHEFPERYKKENKKNEDTLGLFKTITDIGKNLR
ncbi:hypothetical protein HYV10_02675 [Candidatus Dependentiae bacterium]|nr:hypothetical protein [Candidatus Dependentiae bacterium]